MNSWNFHCNVEQETLSFWVLFRRNFNITGSLRLFLTALTDEFIVRGYNAHDWALRPVSSVPAHLQRLERVANAITVVVEGHCSSI